MSHLLQNRAKPWQKVKLKLTPVEIHINFQNAEAISSHKISEQILYNSEERLFHSKSTTFTYISTHTEAKYYWNISSGTNENIPGPFQLP